MNTSVLSTLACLPNANQSHAPGLGQPAMRLTCPTCGKRLRLPQDFASRSGSAPCPRCAAAVVWMGTQADMSVPRHVPAPEPLTVTLVLPASVARASAQANKQAFSARQVVQPPPVTPANAPIPSSAPTPTSAPTPAPAVAEIKPSGIRNLPMAWILGLTVGIGACGMLAGLATLLLVLTSRSLHQPTDDPQELASQQVQTAQVEIDQAKRANHELEEEIAQLRRESQTLQTEIEQLKRRVL